VHVIVVGCGRVGSSLAKQLTESGHTVAVIDRRSEAFERLGANFTGDKIVGIGFDRDRLTQAGIEHADALAAVTSGDNSNVLIARVARETFGLERVVARIYDPRRALIYQRLGIPTVATVSWTTDQVLRRLLPSDEQAHDWIDPTGKVCLVEFNLPSVWAGKKLSGLNEPGQFWLTAVSRLGSAEIVTPTSMGQDGDVLMFVSDVLAVDALRSRLDQGPEH